MSQRGNRERAHRKTEEAVGGFRAQVTKRVGQFREDWHTSLLFRTTVSIIMGGAVIVAFFGAVIAGQLRGAVFEQNVNLAIEQFYSEASIAQERFNTYSSPTIGEAQQVADQIISSLYDPANGLMGATLVRSPEQDTQNQIWENATATATQVRALVTPELRELVNEGEQIAWQSVEIPREDGAAAGILLGTKLKIPTSGYYELYVAYSLEKSEELLSTTFRVLIVAVLGLIVLIFLISWIVLRLLLRPIREASLSAKQLAEGEFESRMPVRGRDELAQLAQSFNQMASSLEDQFNRMERMSKVQTNFVSSVSHELRSPVTTIRMAGQLIYDKREELPPALRRSAELQHSQLLNLDTMLADLLEISRYDAGGMSLATEHADIAQIVTEVVDMAQPLAADNEVEVSVAIIGDTAAEVEPRRVQRIVRNLVVNALEHAEGNPVAVEVCGNDTAVAVRVIDHGVGLSPDQAAHVFDRFWRADASRVRKSGGTGLGLTIAKEDALLHGGTLAAIGELGLGSCFLLTLPKVVGEPYQPPLELELPTVENTPSDPAVASAASTEGEAALAAASAADTADSPSAGEPDE
ncbi:MAG: MtrAB system histidine kinase MtrB [Trueperella sp.]|nr:MtrAB system histidine kinase MtrB [Trueperella sp.]